MTYSGGLDHTRKSLKSWFTSDPTGICPNGSPELRVTFFKLEAQILETDQ